MPEVDGVPGRPRRRAARLREPRLRRGRARGRGILIAATPRILGVDPGSTISGWGVVTGSAACPVLVACGAIALGAKGEFAERLARLDRQLREVVRTQRPDAAAVEAPFHGVSARSALQLAHARGVILAVLAGEGVPVAEYPPATVKKSITGNGRAEKAQIQDMVGRLLAPGRETFAEDVADALAVALCDLSHRAFDDAVGRIGRRDDR